MSIRKILTIIVGAIIALSGLAFTVSFLSNTTPVRSSTEPIFVSSGSNETKVAKAGSTIAEKGSLQFGKFAILQLTNETTSLELVSADFDPKTEAPKAVIGRVNSGSVLAVNLLFGNELTLLDDRLSAMSSGGSFVFEKDEKQNSTWVRVLSGSTKITFADKANSQTFEGILLEGEEVNLDDISIAGIFAVNDPIERVAAWRGKIGTFSSKFEGESKLLGKILEGLPADKSNSFLDFIKENLLFNPIKKENFYSGQLAGFLSAAAQGETDAINDLLATNSGSKRAMLQTVVARALPLTKLFVSETLSPALKEKIIRLADLATPLANFAESAPLTPTEDLNRSLLFIYDDPSNAKLVQNLLTRAKNGISEASAVSAKWLLKIMQRIAKSLNSDWLDTWSTINRARIVDDLDLANAITDQVDLADKLVKAGKETLASNSLKELAGLLNRASQKFAPESLEKIAAQGNELRNRVLFLASLRGEGEFEEKAYQDWLAEKNKNPEQPAETKPSEDNPTQPTNPDRVARPESELTKFLRMGDLPESDTQAEEEKLIDKNSDKQEVNPDQTQPSQAQPQSSQNQTESNTQAQPATATEPIATPAPAN